MQLIKLNSQNSKQLLRFENAEALYTEIISLCEQSKAEPDNEKKKKVDTSIKDVKTQIIACSIALKQVVRTYQLEKS